MGKLFFLVSILYFFSGIFFGIDFTDSFYHLNQALHPADGIYLYPFFLSSLIIKTIIWILGPEIIYLRFLNSLLLFFSLLMPFIFIKIEKPRTEVLFYIACALFLYAPFNVNILGYDSLSIFFLSIIFSLSILYFQNSKLYLLIILSILCAAAVLIRLPNLLVIPFVFLVIGFKENLQNAFFSYKVLKLPLFFFLLTLLWIFFGFFMYYSGVAEFLSASANATSHDLKILFSHYFRHGIKMSVFILLILAGHYFYKKFRNKISKVLLYGILSVFYIPLFIFFVIFSKYSQDFSLFLTSLTIAILILQILHTKKDWYSLKNMVLYLFFLFLFINPFGSITGLIKAVSLFLLFPFVLSIQDLKLKQYWLFILIVLLPFSLIEKFRSTYEDRGIPSLTKTLNLKLLKPIHTSETRADFLTQIDKEMIKLKENKVQVYFYGDKSHVFHYMYPETNLNISSFFQPTEDLFNYPEIEKLIGSKNKVAIFITHKYPGDTSSELSLLEFRLKQDGFKRIIKGSILYYLKIND